MRLIRNEAVEIVAYLEMLLEYDSEKRQNLILSLGLEDDTSSEVDFESVHFNELILSSLKSNYKGMKNEVLSNRLFSLLKINVVIDGEDYSLLDCVCCEYKTISDRGQYEICPVCFWEDDGSGDLDRYSSVNRMTLREAKQSYSVLGTIAKKYSEFKDIGVESQYHKGGIS